VSGNCMILKSRRDCALCCNGTKESLSAKFSLDTEQLLCQVAQTVTSRLRRFDFNTCFNN
jgi:hypothetical protein